MDKDITGEISNLREPSLAGGAFFGGSSVTYKLDSSKVDYALARALYDNTADDYKLGAGFAAPIVNSKAGFMGMPTFVAEDESAMDILSRFVESNRANIHDTLVGAMRDGDAYVYIVQEDLDDALYPETKVRLHYNVIPPERVQTLVDHMTNEVKVYKITTPMEWVDEDDEAKSCTVTQFVSVGEIRTEIDGDEPEGVEVGTIKTGLDFIPIVHFKNRGDNMQYGQSELEPIEPFLKAYHDVMLHAMQGSKMHSTPKLKFNIDDMEAFLENNLSKEQFDMIKRGESVEISLENKELILLEPSDEAGFIEASSAIGDAKEILKYLFYNIVDASETPEFVFGVHTPSSQASVKEQMPVLIRGIEAKRDHFNDAFDRLARIVLYFTSRSENAVITTYATTITWDNIDPRSGNEISEELLNVVNALSTAKLNGLISEQAAIDYLSTKVDTMQTYEGERGEGEAERIKQTAMNSYRMPDTAELQDELERINQQLGEV